MLLSAVRASAALLLGGALVGCAADTTTGTGGSAAAAIGIDPATFVGDVTCSSGAGALQTYVATLSDVTDPTRDVTLPSSRPTACSQRVDFRFIALGHSYVADIDGYDTGLDGELVPFGSGSTGSRHMVRPDAPDVIVAPRWTTHCSGAATAVSGVYTVVGGCDPLVDHGPATPTAISVDALSALGAHDCHTLAIDVVPDDPAQAAVFGLGCDAAPVLYDTDIEPGRAYGFRLVAYADAAGPVTLASRCSATAVAGVTIAATCDPLGESGALDVSIADAVAAAQATCDAGSTYDLSVDGLASTGFLPCSANVHIGPLAPGQTPVALSVKSGSSTPAPLAACTIHVVPGSATLTCP